MPDYFNSEDDCWYDVVAVVIAERQRLIAEMARVVEHSQSARLIPRPATVRRDTSVVANTDVVFAGFWSLP